MNKKQQEKVLRDLPSSPGVYLFKNRKGEILYIGKAKNLKRRVRSYFISGTTDSRFVAKHIHRLVADIEVVLTHSEKEALLLENNLIKEHSPRFNIKLRDDKNYLSLRLDLNAEWPKLEIIRRPKHDGALYFGPYHSASSARSTLKLVHKSFKLRSCKDGYMRNRTRPCIQHQMHRCMAPCVLEVDRGEYLRQVAYVQLFLKGRREDLIRRLKDRMEEAAARFEYERAAMFRDQIRAVEATLSPQRINTASRTDRDVVGLYRQGAEVQIAVLEFRQGRLMGRAEFYYSGQEFPENEVLSSFIMQRYREGTVIPDEVAISKPVDGLGPLSEILSERRKKKVRVMSPKRGDRAEQAEMADLNARQLLESRLKDEDAITERLGAIQRRLRLPRLPRRMECVDISHLGGTNTVGAISAVVDGEVRRNLGRTYRIRLATEGDDFAAMTEVLTRRFTRARAGDPGWETPDLLIVDGGRGQLATALAVLRELSITDQPVVALAKERAEGEEAWSDRVFLPMRKNPIHLKARVSSLHLLALARDEAHRLAVSFQRKVRRKKTLRSDLDRIPGIGPKTQRALLKHLGSVKRIREAAIQDLTAVEGVGEQMAQRIQAGLRRTTEGETT